MMRRTVRRIGATIIRIIMIRMMFISGAARPSTILIKNSTVSELQLYPVPEYVHTIFFKK